MDAHERFETDPPLPGIRPHTPAGCLGGAGGGRSVSRVHHPGGLARRWGARPKNPGWHNSAVCFGHRPWRLERRCTSCTRPRLGQPQPVGADQGALGWHPVLSHSPHITFRRPVVTGSWSAHTQTGGGRVARIPRAWPGICQHWPRPRGWRSLMAPTTRKRSSAACAACRPRPPEACTALSTALARIPGPGTGTADREPISVGPDTNHKPPTPRDLPVRLEPRPDSSRKYPCQGSATPSPSHRDDYACPLVSQKLFTSL